MIFLTDTCFWSHLQDLFSFGNIDLRECLSYFKWGLTKNVLNEISTRQLDSYFPKTDAFVIPLN